MVIGAGAAGMAAATRARRFDPQAHITVLEASGEFSRTTCSLPYYVGGELEGSHSLAAATRDGLAEMRIDLRLNHRVSRIEPSPRRVIIDGTSIEYDRLVVGVGSRPRPVPVLSQGSSLWSLRDAKDARAIREVMDSRPPRSVAVVGGGYLGLEMAEVLTRRGCRITLFHRHQNVMRLLPQTDEIVRSELLHRGVTLRLGCEVRLVSPEASQASVEFDDAEGVRRTEVFDAVLLTAGVVPETDLLAKAGARVGPSGGVVIDSRGETTLSGVYAAGDGVEIPKPYGGGGRCVPLATNAARWGRVCGENAAGGSLRGPAPWGCVGIRLFDSQVASVGHPEEWEAADPVTVSVEPEPHFAPRARATAVFLQDRRSGRLLGAQFVGPQALAWADLASLALHKEMRVSEFSELDLAYTPPLSALWHPFTLAARVAEKRHGREVWR